MNFNSDPDFEPYFYDEATGDGLVTGKYVLLRGIQVLEVPDVAISIKNGASGAVVLTIPASTAVGTRFDCYDVKLSEGAYMVTGAATAGQFSFVAKKYVKGQI